MRRILTTLLLTYEYELCEKSQDWILDQTFYLLWERLPLMLEIRKR
jgi:hypothetical protein